MSVNENIRNSWLKISVKTLYARYFKKYRKHFYASYGSRILKRKSKK